MVNGVGMAGAKRKTQTLHYLQFSWHGNAVKPEERKPEEHVKQCFLASDRKT